MRILFAYFFLTPAGFIFILYQWLMPFSSLNRFKFFDRKSLRTDASDENALKYRRHYINRESYIESRTSFLAMKMGYEPTEKKIDRMLELLRINLAWRKNYKWIEYAELDREILENIKQQLHEGTFSVENYVSYYESNNSNFSKLFVPSVKTTHKFNVLFVICFPVLYILFFLTLLGPFFISESYLGLLANEGVMLMVALPACYSWVGFYSAEETLRRSRDSRQRRIAHWVRGLVLGFGSIIYLMLTYVLIMF